jgi:hypothetical protein
MVHFNTISSTFGRVPKHRDENTWLPSRLAHCPAIVQITLSSAKFSLSIRVTERFRTEWNETVPQLFNVYYASKRVRILLDAKVKAVYDCVGCFIFISLVLQSFWHQVGVLIKSGFDIRDSFICPY